MKKIILQIKKYIKQRFAKPKNPYYDSPFGIEPQATKEDYLLVWKHSKTKKYLEIDMLELEMGFTIEREWFYKLALKTQVVIKESEICYEHGRVLFSVLCSYINSNSYDYINIIEVGTARGFSSLCMAYSLVKMNISGNISTIDPLPHNHKMYWNCISDIEGKKTRQELLYEYDNLINKYVNFIEGKSEEILSNPIYDRVHFAFIDGVHEYQNVMSDFKRIYQFQKVGDIIIFDDYNTIYFPGVVKAVDEICIDYNYSKKVINANSQRGYVIAVKKE